jgi:xanthine dehydrogenase large subunit
LTTTGLVTGLQADHAGQLRLLSADLSGPVADRAVFHADNAYYLSDVEIASYRCKTNTQSHTAFRGFGGPQGVIVIETIMGDIARTLGLDPLDVRRRNLYGVDRAQRHALPDAGGGQHPRAADPQLEHTSGYRRAAPRSRAGTQPARSSSAAWRSRR